MNADRLLANFDTVVDTPGAVPRLRRFILDLAVRGKLVPQDPNDEPVSDLLNRNESEKARRMKLGQIPRRLPLSPKDRDCPHDIPATWSWVRLGQIVSFSTGRTPRRNEPSYWNSGDYAWVSIRDMNDGAVLTSTRETVTKQAKEEIFSYEPEQVGTMLMSFKLTIGKVTRLGIPAYHNEAIIAIRPYVTDIDPYLFAVLPVFARQGNTKAAIKGATLNRTSLSNIPVPLPPVAEQHRITSRIDELMTMCHQLTIAREKREEARDRFTTTSLARLSAPDRPAFRTDAAFTIEHLDRLTARSEQIPAVRRTIIDLAVRGRLVPQDPTDEPAQKLLKRIAEERNRLMKIGEARKPAAGKLTMVRGPFSLPDTWRWAAIGDVFAYDVGIKRESSAMDRSLWLLELQDVEKNTGRLLVRVTAAERESKSTKSEFRAGDILYGKLRPYLNKVLVADERGYSTTEIVALRPYLPLCARYCALALRRRDFVDYVTQVGQGTKMPRLRTKDAIVAPFPLPPLAEQHRIVARADELMTLCDRLEAHLVAAEDAGVRVLDAMLHEALGPNTGGRDAAGINGRVT